MIIDNINTDERVMIIAELSANHGGDIDIAKESIKVAKEVGADAIKLQTYRADTLTIDCDNEYFKLRQGTIWDGRTLYDLYSEAYTPWEWHKELFMYAREIGIGCFSSPFDKTAIDLLEDLDTPAYKIASFEIRDIPMIRYAASKQKPMIISTGIADITDIYEAVEACRSVGNEDIALLKCTSAYPAKIEDANLNTMVNMKDTFDVEIGLSDHTLGITLPIVSVALGGRIIEKHFIIDKSLGGVDSSFSLDREEFKSMVEGVRDAEKSLGIVDYSLSDKKMSGRLISRSLFIVKDIKKGEIFTPDNVKSIRPGYGISPKHIYRILGKQSTKDISRGTPFKWSYIKDIENGSE